MFAQHQFVSEPVPLGVEEVTCPSSAHHLHQHRLGLCLGQVNGGKKHFVDFKSLLEGGITA